MSALFPNKKKTFTRRQDFTDKILAQDINTLYDEVEAIQKYLIENPSHKINQESLGTLTINDSGIYNYNSSNQFKGYLEDILNEFATRIRVNFGLTDWRNTPTRINYDYEYIDGGNLNNILPLDAIVSMDLDCGEPGSPAFFEEDIHNPENPPILLEEESRKAKLTTDGGYAIKLTNKTGSPTVSGKIVTLDSSNAKSFILGADNKQSYGIILDNSIPNNSESWIIVKGIAKIKLKAGVVIEIGDKICVESIQSSTGLGVKAENNSISEIGTAITTDSNGFVYIIIK